MRIYSYGQWTQYLINKMEVREADRVSTTLRIQLYYPAFNVDRNEVRLTLDNCFRISWQRPRAIRYCGIGGSIFGFGAAIEYAAVAMPLDPMAKQTAPAPKNNEEERI